MLNKYRFFYLPAFLCLIIFSSCVGKKKFVALQSELEVTNQQLGKCGEDLNEYMNKLGTCESEKRNLETTLALKQEQVTDLKVQLEELKALRDKQLDQVDGLTELSQSANDNIKETLSQLENKDRYINLLQAAKTRADSINLALAVNLKTVLKDGIEDKDVDIKVDKTVVFVNLSDNMVFQSGSTTITPRAEEVLEKIAAIVKSRPDLEIMVEGYTDNVPIKTDCLADNWDLSVKRATAVVKVLQDSYDVDPNKLIAAGRGQYNALATNDTPEGRTANRRTRIIILPKLNQFYDLLNPAKVPD